MEEFHLSKLCLPKQRLTYNNMDKIIDKYLIFGRIIPSFIASIPLLLVIGHSSLKKLELNFSNISISTIIFISLMYFLSSIGRLFGKLFEDLIFKNETQFPTTALLIKENSYLSEKLRKLIILKIKKNTSFPKTNETMREEYDKELTNGISILRRRFTKNSVLLDLNIQYGFWRNFAANRFLLFSFELIYLFLTIEPFEIIILTISLILSLIFFLFLKQLLLYVGRKYAIYLLNLIADLS